MSAGNAAQRADFRGPLDVTRAATVVLDAQDTVIGWSKTAEELFGFPQQEPTRQPPATLTDVHVPAPTLDSPLSVTGIRVGHHRDGRSMLLATAQSRLPGSGTAARVLVATELVVSELVTNAVRHAEGPLQLRLLRDRTLICEVADTARTSPHLRHAAVDDEGGRGLFIVAQLVHRWGTRYTVSGKTIWTEQAFPSPG